MPRNTIPILRWDNISSFITIETSSNSERLSKAGRHLNEVMIWNSRLMYKWTVKDFLAWFIENFTSNWKENKISEYEKWR